MDPVIASIAILLAIVVLTVGWFALVDCIDREYRLSWKTRGVVWIVATNGTASAWLLWVVSSWLQGSVPDLHSAKWRNEMLDLATRHDAAMFALAVHLILIAFLFFAGWWIGLMLYRKQGPPPPFRGKK